MKKILAISIAFIYLAITTGLVMEIHYCMGREVGSSVKFTDNDSQLCSKCGMKNAKNKCCHDEIKVIKLQDDQILTNFDFRCMPPAAPQQEYNLVHPLLHLTSDVEPVSNHSPPSSNTPSLSILHCVFRL